jgi:S-adenosylmethionine hydrolase
MTHGPIITLTTDFGTRDGFVGQMKGVILRIHPQAVLVDLTHDIEPFDVIGGALVLKGVSGYYPEGSTHVAVVDPGVGSERRGIAVRSNGQVYVGPDNGLFTFVMETQDLRDVRELSNPDFMLPEPHPTFHGRDIFAPVAAWLARGSDYSAVGPPVTDPVLLSIPQPQETSEGLVGNIIYTDRFGNLTSNIPAEQIGSRNGQVSIGNLSVGRICRVFADVEPGRPVTLINSFGFLEIAVNQGNASRLFGLERGAPVQIAWET